MCVPSANRRRKNLIFRTSPSDAIHLPMGTPHTLKVQERLVALQCYAPGGPEQRFKPAPGTPEAK